ncbi:MAG: flavin-containing monooxygenase, partial [Actinomycetota bacterium]
VVVVGAGISGIGAGVHLNDKSPDRSFVILEGREDIGGTWDLFKYPGIRSDSDMHTLGYEFKPWKAEKSIADGPSIMAYLRETVAEHDLKRHMRFGERVVRAEWSTQNATWSVHTQRSDGSQGSFECNYLFMCAGYYSYKSGYLPEFPGREKFRGTIVHPQEWPEDLDYSNKRVVVIGSGATAVTIVPAVAETAAHVTMLQRSPTYMVSRPDTDALANFLRRILPAQLAYNITRAKNTWRQQLVYKKTRSNPDQIKMLLLGGVQLELGGKYPIKRHFLPRYNPWDQRLCLVPNSDFFAAMRSGRASLVTDNIETFTETGILLSSGEHLNADIIVTATGLQLVSLGEADIYVDGQQVDFAQTRTYKGMAYSDVPNLATSFGYINASWTLRADLTCTYVCRLLNHMRDTGTRQCTPRLRPGEETMPRRPWIDGFSSGYMQRVMHLMPAQGDREPWLNPQNYDKDKKMFREGAIDDGVMQFTNPEEEVADAALASSAAR